jgi:hypothetical protein
MQTVLPVAFDVDVLLPAGPACLVGDVTLRPHGVAVFGPVADDAVGKGRLAGVRRSVDADPFWLLLGEQHRRRAGNA